MKKIAKIKLIFNFLFLVFICQLLCFISSDNMEASDEGMKNQPVPKKKANYAEDELLVKFKENVKQEDVEAINKGLDTTTIKKVTTRNLYLIKIPKGESIEDLIMKYNKIPEVEYSESNLKYQINKEKKHDK